jgi:hypothetical protein
MKHIKKFENSESSIYHEGDYVELSEETIEENGLHVFIEPDQDIYENIGMIVGVRGGYGHSYMYNVDYLAKDFYFYNITQNFVYECEIVRKLSQDEVDELTSHIDSIKYNL